MTDTSILEDTKEENGKRVLQDMQDLFPIFFCSVFNIYGMIWTMRKQIYNEKDMQGFYE